MTAVQITGGTFKHVVPSNYNEGRHGAEATLTFMAAEGATQETVEKFARYVAITARALALSMASGVVTTAAPAQAVSAAIPTPTASLPAGASTPAPMPGAPIPATPAPTPAPMPASGPASSPLPAVAPAGAGPVAAVPIPVVTIPASPAPAAPAPSPAAPSDVPSELVWDKKTLSEHLTRAAARLAPTHGEAAPEMIRALIQRFLPEGAMPSAAAIPEEHRATFLTQLTALQ